MISPNTFNALNNQFVWTIKATNNIVPNTGVFVTVNIPSYFTVTGSYASHGSLVGNTWTIGNMAANQVDVLNITLKVISLPSTSGPQSLVATISGLDTNPENNVLTDVINYTTNHSCNDDPCIEPVVSIVNYEEPNTYKIKGKVPGQCDRGTSLYTISNEVNCDATINQVTGEYEVDVSASDLKLPWSFNYTISCINKCFNRDFGPGTISGIGYAQQTIEVADSSITYSSSGPKTYDLTPHVTSNNMCLPITYSVVSSTIVGASVNASTGLLSFTMTTSNETIVWKATCTNGTTLSQGILSIIFD